jgi:hypothetical protein
MRSSSHHTDITERPVVEHEYESLQGKMTSFSYMMLGSPDQIARRERSCLCEASFLVRGRANMQSALNAQLLVLGCISGRASGSDARQWSEQTTKNLGTGLAGRRKEAQAQGKALAKALKPGGLFAVQARERWSAEEEQHLRRHYWLAQAGEVLSVTRIEKRQTISSTMFSEGDSMVRVGRYFDRDAADPSGMTFEEWQPLTVFSEGDVGSMLTIAKGQIKVGRTTCTEVYWGKDAPPEVEGALII